MSYLDYSKDFSAKNRSINSRKGQKRKHSLPVQETLIISKDTPPATSVSEISSLEILSIFTGKYCIKLLDMEDTWSLNQYLF